MQAGFDPLLQFVHADDAVGALEALALSPLRGPVNVAGEGSISLSACCGSRGMLALPVPSPLFPTALSLGRRFGLSGDLPPDAVPWLRYGLTIDCRRLIEQTGFRPRTTVETVSDFIARTHVKRALSRAPARAPRRQDAWRDGSDDDCGRLTMAVRPSREGLFASTTQVDLPDAVELAARPLPRSARGLVERAARRMRGENLEDEWGFDEDFVELVYPFLRFMYERWWRVTGDRRDERAGAWKRDACGEPRGRAALGRDDDRASRSRRSIRCRATRASWCSTGRSGSRT